jgi:hypothetical protein
MPGGIMSKKQNETAQNAFLYLTVKQFAEEYSAFSIGSIRSLIFFEDTNGLAKSGSIIRLGRKILINPTKFFAWVESKNGERVQ